MKIYLLSLIFAAYTGAVLSSERRIEELALDLKILNQGKLIPAEEKVKFFDALFDRKMEEIRGEIKLQQKLLATPAHERWQVELICRR